MITKRILLGMTDPQLHELLYVHEQSGTLTMAEAVRHSIHVNSLLLRESLKGSRLIIRDRNGEEKEIMLVH